MIDFARHSRGVSHSQIVQFGLNGSKFYPSLAKRLQLRDIYELAVDTLEREFYAIGIAEKFEESIFVFARLCGLDSIKPWQHNKGNKKINLLEKLTDKEVDTINDIYEWDFELYKYALKRFESQIKGIKFSESLDKYKRACSEQYKEKM